MTSAARRVRGSAALPTLVGIAIAVAPALSGCSTGDDATTPAKVCGIVDPALITRYVGSSDYTWNGQPDGSPFGSDCTVLRSGRSVLVASVLRFRDDTEATDQAARIRGGRPSMRKDCPRPRFFDDWATGNACIKSPRSLSLVVATKSYSIQLLFESPAKPITVREAEAIAEDISTNMAGVAAS